MKNRSPISWRSPAISKANLLEFLESLTWRSLIEKGKDAAHKASTFTQQPVVMEYVTDRLVPQGGIQGGHLRFIPTR